MSAREQSLTGRTAVLAVVGDPIAHSLSPRIHNGWIRAHGLDAVYVALNLKGASAEIDIAALARAGLVGLNVTLPYKSAALAASVDASPEARRIGAANTLVRNTAGDGWTAHNTDVAGFRQMLEMAAPGGVGGRSVLVVGAGGAARAAALVLAEAGARISIVNRTSGTAERLAAELCPEATICGWDALAGSARETDLIVQTTSIGHGGADMPALPEGRGRPFLELSYGAAATKTLGEAERSGWTPHDGLVMLSGQAAAAFSLWFGLVPNMHAALADCRNALANP